MRELIDVFFEFQVRMRRWLGVSVGRHRRQQVGLVDTGAGELRCVSLGRVALGRVALGRVALGRVALGRVALGRVALGRVALGRVALGRVALGRVTLGRVALGRVALGRVAGRRCSVVHHIQVAHLVSLCRPVHVFNINSSR